MFDTYVTTSSPAYAQTIHEHRAPTDKSVELLSEMEKAVRARVISSATITNNKLSIDAVTMRHAMAHLGYEVFAVFKLNGEEYVLRFDTPDPHYYEKSEFQHKLFDAFAKAVAYALFTHPREL